jgi:hypothetical protein
MGINQALENITIGGTVTTGDQVKINAYDASFSANPQVVSYTVASGDTANTIANHLASGFAVLGSNSYFSATEQWSCHYRHLNLPKCAQLYKR